MAIYKKLLDDMPSCPPHLREYLEEVFSSEDTLYVSGDRHVVSLPPGSQRNIVISGSKNEVTSGFSNQISIVDEK